MFSEESQLSLDGFLFTVKFIKTRAYTAILEKLQQYHHVVILGRPGDGKTTLGFQVLHALKETHDSNPLIPKSLALGFLSQLPDGQKMSIFLDDMFGIYTVSEKAMSMPLVFKIRSIIRKGNFLVMSMRKDIYLQCKMQLPKELFGQGVVIDLSDPEFVLLEQEKRAMLLQSIPNIEEDTMRKILNHQTFTNQHIGFPQCVALMKESRASDFQDILDMPLCYVADQMYLLFENCREKFLALIMAFINNGNICTDEVDILRQALPHGVDISCGAMSISEAMKNLCGTYFQYNLTSDQYVISHESVMEGMARTLWHNMRFYQYFIKTCPERFLTRISGNNSETFPLPDRHLSVLFERLCSLLESKVDSSYMIVASLELWHNEKATSNFTECLKHKGTSCIDKNGTSLLVHAATQGCLNIFRSILRDDFENTKELRMALCKASEYCHLNILNYILSRNVSLVDLDVLFHAIKSKSVEIFQTVYTVVEDVDITSERESMTCMFFSGFNPIQVNLLEEVVLSGNLSLLMLIVESEHLDVFDLFSNNPRMAEFAAFSGSIDLMQFVDKYGSVECPHLLWWAACSGSTDMMRYLLSKGCQLCKHKFVSCDDRIKCAESLLSQTERRGACLKYNIEIAKLLLETKEFVRTKNIALLSPFFGSLDNVKYMEAKSDLTQVSDEGCNVLHFAAWQGQIDIVRYLADKYQSLLYMVNKKGETPLHFAALSGSIEVVECFARKGCDIFHKNIVGGTILHYACQEGKLTLVKHLLDNYPALLTIRDDDGQTPLHTAGESDCVELVDYLIRQKQCDVFDKDTIGRTILNIACQEGKVKLVRNLVENFPALLTMKKYGGFTPLYDAGLSGSVEIVDYLIGQCCDVLSKTNTGKTVLHAACRRGILTLVKHLVENYPGLLKIKDNNGMSPLHSAGSSGSIEVVDFLLSQQCDICEKDSYGWTILHYACQEGKLILVKHIVVNYPVLLTTRSTMSFTPLHAAELSDSVELVEYLINQQCDVRDKDNDGGTILHIACKKRQTDTCQTSGCEIPSSADGTG